MRRRTREPAGCFCSVSGSTWWFSEDCLDKLANHEVLRKTTSFTCGCLAVAPSRNANSAARGLTTCVPHLLTGCQLCSGATSRSSGLGLVSSCFAASFELRVEFLRSAADFRLKHALPNVELRYRSKKKLLCHLCANLVEFHRLRKILHSVSPSKRLPKPVAIWFGEPCGISDLAQRVRNVLEKIDWQRSDFRVWRHLVGCSILQNVPQTLFFVITLRNGGGAATCVRATREADFRTMCIPFCILMASSN